VDIEMGWLSNLSKSKTSESDLVVDALNRAFAVIEFEPDGTIINANQNFLGVMGYQLSEVQGHHHSMFVERDFSGSDEYQNFWKKTRQGRIHQR
jgi:methyl-accepting chemotaxis protein